MTTTDWHGCYSQGWGDMIVPEAFQHPAKASYKLAERIYRHIMAEGWAQAGDTVVDPFGGICGCGLHAALNGLHFVGCELEPKFVALGQQNIDMWNRRYSEMPKWGSARIVQGDSRRLQEVLCEAGIVVSSPPYADCPIVQRADGDIGGSFRGGRRGTGAAKGKDTQYNTLNPHNLGTMKATDAGLAAVVSSPPYAGSAVEKNSDGVNREAQYETYLNSGGGASFEAFCKTQQSHSQGYGHTGGQLAAMRPGNPVAVVSSPPFEDCNPKAGGKKGRGTYDYNKSLTSPECRMERVKDDYARYEEDSSLGNSAGDDFWTAARTIVEQVHAVLRPGGHAIWIVKAFVRKGKIVDFPGQWRAMCESVGFCTIHEHRALLTEHRGTQMNTAGEAEAKNVKRVSFFRRLHEAKRPDTAINWETVYCTVRQ